MRKNLCFLFVTVLLPLGLGAQTIQGRLQGVSGNSYSSTQKTSHYELFAEAGAESRLPSLARELELRFESYNQLFRFNPAMLPSLLRVRVFADPVSYETYVSSRLGTPRVGATYLHYNNSERRELVILRGSADEAHMVAHLAFIQFIRAFISNPPAWIREGFAIYFNSLRFDPLEESLSYEENLTWLETVKELGRGIMFPREIILADTVAINDASPSGNLGPTYSEKFQVCSWALVSFFMNSNEYMRSLTDCFMVLSPQASAQENSRAVMNRLSIWIDFYSFDREFLSYLDSRKTFTELMETGRRSHDAGDSINAELAFLAARDLSPTHYGPHYYLGLLYYEAGMYDLAEENYRLSLEYGADEASASYALGINALSAGRLSDSRSWLEKAAAADPARYRERVGNLLRRFQN